MGGGTGRAPRGRLSPGDPDIPRGGRERGSPGRAQLGPRGPRRCRGAETGEGGGFPRGRVPMWPEESARNPGLCQGPEQ